MRLESIRRDRRIVRAAFEHLLGLSDGSSGFETTDTLKIPAERVVSEADLIEQALLNRVDVRVAAADLDAAEADIKQQDRAVVPSIAIGIDGERPEARAPKSLKPLPQALTNLDLAGLTSSEALNKAIARSAQTGQTPGSVQFQNARDRLLQGLDASRERQFEKSQRIDLLLGPSIQITLPVWDQNRAQIAKAHMRLTQKQKDYAELLLGIVRDVKQAVATLDAIQELLRISNEEALPLAEQNIGTAERVYEAGEDTILALLLAQENYNSQREANIALRGDYYSASADLELAVGGLPSAGSQDALADAG